MESYKDDYPNHAKGICQEAIQNSVDARQSPQAFRDLTIVIEYDSTSRVLRIRDYGTTGMSHCNKCAWGVKPETFEDCHEQDCRWGNFHYLGGLAKGPSDLGFRGQGKSLAIVAGSRFTVRTKVLGTEHIAAASEWTREGDEWFWELVPEQAMKPVDKPGTEIIIHGVIDEVHNQLMDAQEIRSDIARTWFKVIDKGTTIRYGYEGKELKKIGPPKWPDAGHARRRASIPVSVNRAVVGELSDIEMFLAPETLPEEMRGIALIRNGTQVIERIASWGRNVPVEHQDKLYGWAVYHTSNDRPFLNLAEKPGHRGFRPHTYYRKVKELLQQQVDEFVLPLARQQLKPRVTERDRLRAQENLEIIQAALQEVTDFNPWTGEGELKRKRQTRPPPPHPYVSEIVFDKETYARGDTAKVIVVILNPTLQHHPFLHLTVETLDSGLSQLAVRELPPTSMPLLKPATDEEKGRVSPEITFPITDDYGAGKNWVRVTLLNRPPSQDPSGPTDNTLWDKGSKALWVDATPSKHTRKQPTGGPDGNQNNQGSLRGLSPITDVPEETIETEVTAFWNEGEIWFFTRGPRMGPVYESEPRTADTVLFELVSEVFAERVMELRLENDVRETFDKSQMLEEFKRVEDSRKRFLRACERQKAHGDE